MRFFAMFLQVVGIILCPIALTCGLLMDHGMGIELTLMFIGLAIFYTGRALEPHAS